jgi:hypothetical protein
MSEAQRVAGEERVDVASPAPPPRLARLGVDRTRLIAFLLFALWLLNLADLFLTRRALWLGFADESNGVMGYFIHHGTLAAGVFKVGIVSLGAALLWLLRRHRCVALAAALLTAVFAAVVAYQVLWLASL